MNQISAVACDGDGSVAVMERSDRTSSSVDCVMGGFSKPLQREWLASSTCARTFRYYVLWSVPNSSKVRWNSSCDDKGAVVMGLSCRNDLVGRSRGDGRGCRVGSGVVARGGGEAARGDIEE